MNAYVVEKLTSERIALPDVHILLKISLGLVLFMILSFALVYAETIPVNVEGTTYDVEYTATGMTVSSIEADLDFVSLILTVDVTDSPGILDITLDRSLLDSTFQGLDDNFIILADGDEPTFTEIASNSQSRTLSIELPSGTEEVEIIGSSFNNSVSVPTDNSDADKAAADKAAPKVQCGPGTILKDGACILDSTPQPTQTSVKGMGKELLIGVVAAFVIAGTVGLILGIMSKASKSKNN